MSLLGAVAMRRLRAAWVLLVVAASVLRTSGDLDAAGPSPLLVSLLDGTVQAVDHETGDLLWSFSSGGALVQAHAKPLDGATWDDPPSDSDVIALRKTRGAPAVVFPGVDGALYDLEEDPDIPVLPEMAPSGTDHFLSSVNRMQVRHAPFRAMPRSHVPL